ncbi:MAG: hypothetical protein ACI4QS_05450 [Comamonas sp.]
MKLAVFASLAALSLTACLEQHTISETLKFPPGVDIEFKGQPAKLYGTSQCAQGQLTGSTCLIFSPHDPKAKGVIVSTNISKEVELIARRDPQDPVRYVVMDDQGHRLLSTTGQHDRYANMVIAQ